MADEKDGPSVDDQGVMARNGHSVADQVRLREWASGVASEFTQVDFDPAAAIKEILGMGEEEWEAFNRTELKNEQQVNRWAHIITTTLREIDSARWKECPWVKMPIAITYLSIKAYLLVSLRRTGRKEAVITYARLVVPQWESGHKGKDK